MFSQEKNNTTAERSDVKREIQGADGVSGNIEKDECNEKLRQYRVYPCVRVVSMSFRVFAPRMSKVMVNMVPRFGLLVTMISPEWLVTI